MKLKKLNLKYLELFYSVCLFHTKIMEFTKCSPITKNFIAYKFALIDLLKTIIFKNFLR